MDTYLGDGILATFGAVRRGGRRAGQGLAALRDVLVLGDAWMQERSAAGLAAPAVCATLDVER